MGYTLTLPAWAAELAEARKGSAQHAAGLVEQHAAALRRQADELPSVTNRTLSDWCV